MSGTEQQENEAVVAFRGLVADEWESWVRENPLLATRCGDHRFDDRLPAVSEADAQRRLAQDKSYLERLRAIDPGDLPRRDQLNRVTFERMLRDRIADAEFHAYRMPLTRLGGFYTNFAELPRVIPLDTLQDYEHYISRLRGFAAYAEGYLALMRDGIRSGHVQPGVALDGIEETVRPHVVQDPTQSLLYAPLAHLPERIGKGDRERLCEAGRAAIRDAVVPGYRALLRFLVDEYVPAARAEIAASTLPDGEAYYAHCVRKFTTLDVTPQEVHDIGRQEVRRIRAEMD